jgi:hypothetical protein
LRFAELEDPVKDMLQWFRLFTRFDEQTFFAMLGEAVSAHLHIPGVPHCAHVV